MQLIGLRVKVSKYKHYYYYPIMVTLYQTLTCSHFLDSLRDPTKLNSSVGVLHEEVLLSSCRAP